MNNINNKLQHYLEILIITLLVGVPLRIIGSNMRTFVYRLIFTKIGHKVYIQDGVEFIGAQNIEIGDYAGIYRGAHIDASGHDNNRISLGAEVQIKQGVTFQALNDTQIWIDRGVLLGPYVSIAGPGNIKIGKSCMIAAKSGIYANNHIFSDLTIDIALQGVTRKGIVIEDDCWLGHAVTVRIGSDYWKRKCYWRWFSSNKRYSSLLSCSRCTSKSN
ncbi:putative acetyl transferase [Calothrix sp. NIES-4071]|nr:putative acetyl transferase [Calothrix sp. NIES-4071]BAZ55204.1 putative acetyl transferase [Calothrix sp. NIES-4105]